jgi:hypothetical protein
MNLSSCVLQRNKGRGVYGKRGRAETGSGKASMESADMESGQGEATVRSIGRTGSGRVRATCTELGRQWSLSPHRVCRSSRNETKKWGKRGQLEEAELVGLVLRLWNIRRIGFLRNVSDLLDREE